MKIVPVILSGGAGTRLWPVSRQALPKPFLKVGGDTLFSQTLARGLACGTDEAMIVTNQDYLHLTQELVAQTTNTPHIHYLLEPKGRNTAPAIALAALACQAQHGADCVMLVLAADHLIPDTESFVTCAVEATKHALAGQLVVFGVWPQKPEIGYGYIEVEKADRKTQKALRFVEKPDSKTAQAYLETGRFYWNSGMFCFTASSLLASMREHAPQVLAAAEATFDSAKTTQTDTAPEAATEHITRFDTHAFVSQPDISIDYAVMEQATNVTMVPAKFDWSDVGSWPSIAESHHSDTSGNTFLADVVDVDTTGTHVQVESYMPKVVATVGVKDLVIVDTPDALLVADKAHAGQVKHVVDALKVRSHETTTLPAVVRRPWGTYAALREEAGYKVKRITVKPGQALSLQYHHHRAEHWVVVQGIANVQVGEQIHKTLPGQYHYIPQGETHRLTNIGTDELVLIEVQCGTYLGEDDIVRLQDNYGRVG